MSNLFWLSDEQMERLEPFFTKSRGELRDHGRRVLSEIDIFNRNCLRCCDVRWEYGTPKTLHKHWKRSSDMWVFTRMMQGVALEAAVPKTVTIDAAYLKAHRTATTMRVKKGDDEQQGRLVGRTKGGINAKLHDVTDA